ncbi:MAG TPA: D-alanyl-D-alanine carboxypeptidase [Cyanobacteria bacterium UBA8803]|nr:D-alanyl-D-alanine carboxypeptidase [Cyanobacteria bacterium UBA9273]HBL59853.1 D-alanyl-D-alanine carboxypeptidase [Cyanobacteria bacterium UBA8803]
MNNRGFPKKPANLEEEIEEDIPVAVRDTPDTKRPSKWKPVLLVVSLLGCGAIAISLILSGSTRKPISSPEPTTTASSTPSSSDTTDTNNLLGHLPYEEAPPSELKPITPDGKLKLRTAAAEKFKAMLAAARADGVILIPISGFRSVQDQQHLFFDIKAQRGQVATKRAEVSAPPGYSEHHTGYAVDIGDSRTPATNLSPSFAQTAAFKWLEKNAAHYSFELSFPPGNPQGVNYEPWHWRFVGDSHSLETFYKAHNLIDRTTNESPTPSPSPSN